MKKFLSMFLALCILCTALPFSANAAYLADANKVTENTASNANTAGEVAGDPGDEIGSVDIPVNITTKEETNVTHVWAVSYDVTELAFEFTSTEDRIWNPETLKYEVNVTNSWDTLSQNITVTNYSDVAITVTPSNSTPVDDGVTVTLGNALNLASAFDGELASAGTAKSGTISVSVSGTPEGSYANATKLTTVTLTVEDARS